MTTSTTTADAARRESLEAEREFLLKSLDDLERERAEGGIDDATYQTLRSDYTARAAEVLRELKGAKSSGAGARPARQPLGRRAALVVAALVFGAFGTYALARSAGQREPNGTITGNVASQAAQIPDTYQGHLEAGIRLWNSNDPVNATKEFVAASKKDPTKAEPHAQLGCMLVQIAGTTADSRLVDSAQRQLDDALRIDSRQLDATLCYGIMLVTERRQPEQARPYLERYLRDAPKNAPARQMATQLLGQMTAGSTTTTNG